MRVTDMLLWFLKQKKLNVIMELEQNGVQHKLIEITSPTIKEVGNFTI